MTIVPPIEAFPNPPDDLSYDQVRLYFVHLVPGDPSREFVPAYHFRILLADHTNVGHLNFRVGDTDHVRLAAGHIGFSIRESCRGHGYALQACRAVASFVRIFYHAVIITCDPANHASLRTLEKLGARFTDEIPVPPHDPHYQRGTHTMRRYQWTP